MKQIEHKTLSAFTKIAIAIAAVALVSSFVGVRLTAQQHDPAANNAPRTLPVRTTTVKFQNGYFARRTFTGRAVAGRTSSMSFEFGGTIKSVLVDIGSVVKAGAPLAELDTARLDANKNQMLAERDETTARLDLAERTFKRAQETFNKGHASAQKLDEAEANAISLRAQLKRLQASVAALDVDLSKAVIRAPFAGMITLRNLDEGTVVAGGTAILELTETSRLEAHIGMPPEHALAVQKGAKFTLRNSRKKIIEGVSVRTVVPVINGTTRTMMVVLDIPFDSVARGELLHASVQNWQEAPGAWVPLRALASDVRGLWRVYKVDSKTNPPHVRFENVQILHSEAGKAFVSGTLSDGDVIIADGLARLARGQRVSIVTTPNTRS